MKVMLALLTAICVAGAIPASSDASTRKHCGKVYRADAGAYVRVTAVATRCPVARGLARNSYSGAGPGETFPWAGRDWSVKYLKSGAVVWSSGHHRVRLKYLR